MNLPAISHGGGTAATAIYRPPLLRDFQVEIAVPEGWLLQALPHGFRASRSYVLLYSPLNEVAALTRPRHPVNSVYDGFRQDDMIQL